jgi:RNA polymerase sigma factor (sigma-70 family)
VGSRISPEAAKAVAALFEAEASSLFGYACTLPGVSRSDAEDLVQVTFQEAMVKWEQCLYYRDQESLRRWLYCVLRRRAISEWRKYGSRQVPLDRLESASGPAEETYHNALASVTRQRCWEIIAAMSEARQRVVFLKWELDWSNAEIAEFLGISESTVRGHQKYVRDQLGIAIDPETLLAEFGENPGQGVAS